MEGIWQKIILLPAWLNFSHNQSTNKVNQSQCFWNSMKQCFVFAFPNWMLKVKQPSKPPFSVSQWSWCGFICFSSHLYLASKVNYWNVTFCSWVVPGNIQRPGPVPANNEMEKHKNKWWEIKTKKQTRKILSASGQDYHHSTAPRGDEWTLLSLI